MMVVFADSFYFFALANPNDPANGKAVQFTGAYTGDVVTTGWILTEMGDGFAKPVQRRSVFLQVVDELSKSSKVRIVPLSEGLQTQGVALYSARPDKEWSLTDCISFVVMQHEGITEALTGDRHFEQAGFVALLK